MLWKGVQSADGTGNVQLVDPKMLTHLVRVCELLALDLGRLAHVNHKRGEHIQNRLDNFLTQVDQLCRLLTLQDTCVPDLDVFVYCHALCLLCQIRILFECWVQNLDAFSSLVAEMFAKTLTNNIALGIETGELLVFVLRYKTNKAKYNSSA